MACDHSQPCGCNQDELTTLPDPCDTTNCVGEPCDQIIDCNCVRYTGADIPQMNINTGDPLCDVITSIVALGGIPGTNGASAYEIWLADGNTGTEQDFLDSLKGDTGNTGAPGTNGNSGAKGNNGDNGDNGDYVETTVEAPGVNCLSGGLKVVVKSGINDSILTTNYICNSPLYKAMHVYGAAPVGTITLPSIPALDPSEYSAFQGGQIIKLGGVVLDEWGTSYNPSTGIWVCPEDGYYDFSYYVHLTHSFSVAWGVGTMAVALMNSASTGQYGGNQFITTADTIHIDMQGGMNLVPFTTGQTLMLKLLNNTPIDYTPFTGDIIRFSVRKVKPL